MISIANNIIFFKGMVNDIPILTCSNECTAQKPLIIFSHGFMGKKEDWKENMKELANLGYYTVAIDNRLHGERKDAGLNSVISSDGKVNFYEVFKAIKGNAEDIIQVLDYFTAKVEIDKNRIAMVGMSMGGFTTFRTVVIDKRVKVAIPIIASSIWGDLPRDKLADDSPEIIKELNSLSRQFSPSNFIDRFYPTALFMQVGSNDKHFNIDKLKHFYEEIKHFYIDDKSKLDLIIYDGIEHEFTEPMWINTKLWLERYL